MKSALLYRIAWLALASPAMLAGLPAHADQAAERSVRDESFVTDTKSDALEISKGFTSVLPLDFVPSAVSVGNPDVLGLDVVEGGRNPQVRLVGLSPGATNIIVFDQAHKPKVVMEVTVGEPTYGRADKVSVYRQTSLEDVVCTAGQCEKLK